MPVPAAVPPQSASPAPSARQPSSVDLLAGLDIHASPTTLFSAHKQSVPSAFVSSSIVEGGIGGSRSEAAPAVILPMLEPAAGEGQRDGSKKSLTEKDVERLRGEAEKLEHLVGGLTSRSLQGTVPLDTKWREILKLADQSGRNPFLVSSQSLTA